MATATLVYAHIAITQGQRKCVTLPQPAGSPAKLISNLVSLVNGLFTTSGELCLNRFPVTI